MDLERPPLSFDRFTIDFRLLALRAGGKTVPLDRTAFRLLVYLIDHRTEARSRDRIHKDLWWDTTVDPSNFNVQLSNLRAALRKAGCSDELIITLPRAHYRFIGEVRDADLQQAAPIKATDQSETRRSEQKPEPSAPQENLSLRWARWASFTGIGLVLALASLTTLHILSGWLNPEEAPPRLSIAVLPFRNLSDDQKEYLADAITDDLTTDLAHIPGSTVIARESADLYRGKSLPTQQIGRELKIRYLLEGSVRLEGNSIDINAQLIDAASGHHLWAKRFGTDKGDLKSARNTIVRELASALDFRLIAMEGSETERDRLDNPDALGLFFRARYIRQTDDSLAGFEKAQEYLSDAIRLNHNFTDAIAELGLTLANKVRSNDDPTSEKDWPEAKRMVARALALAPKNGIALAALARLSEMDGDCQEANASARSALDDDPNSMDALAVMARCAMSGGQLEQAANIEEEILRRNPESSMNKKRYELLAQARLLQGRYQEAIDYCEQAMAGEPPPNPGHETAGRREYCNLIIIAGTQLGGRADQARALFKVYQRAWLHRSTWRIYAYTPHSLSALPSFARFLEALQAAGMPEFVDEHIDEHIPPPDQPQNADEFAPTPLSAPGAITLDTAAATKLMRENHPIVLDLGEGTSVIEGAGWENTSNDDNSFIDHYLHEQGCSTDKPIIVMATGTYGFDSYNGVLHLVSSGYRRVFWYRGGEEAWAAHKLPATDRRN